jgi:probable HAF family extracellular repeat protein
VIGYADSEALAINSSGQIVGWSSIVGGGYNQKHAFLYSNSQILDLGTLGGSSSSAIGINYSGEVIGWSGTANSAAEPFIYKNREMTNLNTLIPGLTKIDTDYLFLNNIGQIAGTGLIGGETHGFLLTPTNLSISGPDCIFNWAERNYPQFFSPIGTGSAIFSPYYFRYYSSTENYLALSLTDDHIWVLGPISENQLLDVGSYADLLAKAGCPQ